MDQNSEEAVHQRAWVVQLVAAAQSRDFFGDLTIKFEKGQIKRVRNETNLVPPPFVPTNGGGVNVPSGR